MAEDPAPSNARWGIARITVLVLGAAYVVVAVVEVLTQDTLSPVLEYSTPLNAIHWAVGVLLLIAAASGEGVSRQVARIAGVLLGVAAIWFVLDRTAFQMLLDYPYPQPHPIPGSYIALYGITGVAALVAGFRRTGRRSVSGRTSKDRARVEAS
jgi:hypothetical protein